MSTKNPTPSDRRRGSRASLPAKKPKYKPAVKAPPPPRATAESQEILDLFRNAFSTLFTPHLSSILQTVKQHLFNRDFLQAFGVQENLEAYVVRWSPSRALAYREVFLEICPEIRGVFDLNTKREEPVEVVCIGGGAGAEVVAIAAAVKSLLRDDSGKNEENEAPSEDSTTELPPKEPEEAISLLEITPPFTPDIEISKPTPNAQSLHLIAIDIANWTPIIKTLSEALTTPVSPRYPSFISPSAFSVTFHHHDILTPSVSPLVSPSTSLITLLFTTNELYTQSRASTTQFLLSLKESTRAGCLLLVLESAGSYSTVQVNGKTFPMGMLLDHTLLAGDVWEKLVGEEAKWYRLPEGLRYPIELENMRYFVRVYRRV